jgi:hypothetical protein
VNDEVAVQFAAGASKVGRQWYTGEELPLRSALRTHLAIWRNDVTEILLAVLNNDLDDVLHAFRTIVEPDSFEYRRFLSN